MNSNENMVRQASATILSLKIFVTISYSSNFFFESSFFCEKDFSKQIFSGVFNRLSEMNLFE